LNTIELAVDTLVAVGTFELGILTALTLSSVVMTFYTFVALIYAVFFDWARIIVILLADILATSSISEARTALAAFITAVFTVFTSPGIPFACAWILALTLQ
jgi:hypothetical protein